MRLFQLPSECVSLAGFAMTKFDKKRNVRQVTDKVVILSLECFLLGLLPSPRSPSLCARSYHSE